MDMLPPGGEQVHSFKPSEANASGAGTSRQKITASFSCLQVFQLIWYVAFPPCCRRVTLPLPILNVFFAAIEFPIESICSHGPRSKRPLVIATTTLRPISCRLICASPFLRRFPRRYPRSEAPAVPTNSSYPSTISCFVVVDVHTRRDMHGVDQYQSLHHRALFVGGFNLRSDIQIGASGFRLEP